MIKRPVIDILTPETFVHCQCYLGIGRTTHGHDHNRCILLRISGSMILLFFSTFPFTCLGSTFETCVLFVFRPFCLFHLGSFIPLSVGLFFELIASNAFPIIRKAAEANAATSEVGAPAEIATATIDSSCLLSIFNKTCSAFSDSSSICFSFFVRCLMR